MNELNGINGKQLNKPASANISKTDYLAKEKKKREREKIQMAVVVHAYFNPST